MFDDLFSSYDLAIIRPYSMCVRFEDTKKGWYEEIILTKDLAHWILMHGMEVEYEY